MGGAPLCSQAFQRIDIRHKMVQTEPMKIEVGQGKTDLPPVPQRPPSRRNDGLHIPPLLRDVMTTFPSKTRVVTEKAIDKQLVEFYLEKYAADVACIDAGNPVLETNAALYQFMMTKYGLVEMARGAAMPTQPGPR